ncbi:hypothetical protein DV738_g2919, partial [Chaetothyriales sp. CBS 135597]
MVYALDTRRVVKRYDGDNDEEIRAERQVYERLGHHPNIAEFLGVLDDGSSIVLERGKLLRNVLSREPPGAKLIPLRTKYRWIKQAATGLQYLHDHNIIHADVGCRNMIIVTEGNNLKLIDFEGCSIDGEGPMSSYEWFSYRPSNPRATVQTDIFALGCAIYEVVTGSPPYYQFKELSDAREHHVCSVRTMSTPYGWSPFDTSALLLKLRPQLQDGSEEESSSSTLIWQGFHFDCRLENETFRLDEVKEERLPELETGLFELKFDDGAALTPVDASSSVSDYTTADEDNEERRPKVTLPTTDPVLNSWDTFLKEQKKGEEPCPAYLSEANPSVFDAVVQATCNTPVKRVKPDYFLNALYELSLGRNSSIFVWDEQASTFNQRVAALTVTGFTPGTIQAAVDEFRTGADLFRRLQRRHGQHGRADTIAFHVVLRSCLLSIEAYMERQKPNICSVLSLRRVYATVETETVLHNVFAQSRLLQVAQEAHESLCLLDKVGPERLAAMAVPGSGRLLRLAFSWAELDTLEQDATRYESEARSRLQRAGKGEVSHETVHERLHSTVSNSEADDADELRIDLLPQLNASSSELLPRDDVQNVALHCLMSPAASTDSLLAVPLSEVLDLSLSPFIFAQHRLLSYSVLNALFSTYQFSSHLHMLRQIHLFGDGMFTARLSMALFDSSDDDNNEGADSRGHSTSTITITTPGLRLQTRDSWPPASSELRLVLMGILSDSIRSSSSSSSTASLASRELEDTTSFAIRELSDDELEACRDVNSIHALDFLKLQYKPPNQLLEAYDAIFKHMLRVLRLKNHFITTLADYSANIAIALPWARLQDAVGAIESRLAEEDYDGTVGLGRRLISNSKGEEGDGNGNGNGRIEPLAHLVLVLDFNGYWK